MITLYQFEISPFCDKTRRALTYKGLEFEIREMLPSQEAENLKVSPTHKFPAIDCDGERIVDSTDIAYYLEQKYPEPQLAPSDPAGRAHMHIIEDWADESLFPYDLAMRGLWEHNIPLLIDDIFKYETPELQKMFAETVPEGIRQQLIAAGLGRKDKETILNDVRRHINAVNDLLQAGDWLVADHLTYSDIAVAAMFFVINRAEEGAAMLDEFATIRQWQNRVDELTL
ncbi:MAG: glutathione S-transferase family protein [Gammaproteobacteria bacterium]|jgi:glutathione S-transferase|nr:glutathione S-transferase family protein [Gammaproteobacteria bacterium]MBT4493143.1 glutathione S-transferase family protein [Gammaproteobacteria bacterium]MBT7371783.1 glutathione S-transferase family protein [Gammaproteobacteria bacterium]